MALKKILPLLILILLIQITSFSQEINSDFIANAIKEAVKNDPKRHLKEKFDNILPFNVYYDLKERAEFSDTELKKYLGDLWVLKYQYKISEDKTLLKPILLKSLAINESIYDFDNKNDYVINYLKVMPEDSVFSESFLPIIIAWSRSVNDLGFQSFVNMPLKSSKNKYYRDMITYRRFLQSIEKVYLSDFCKKQWDELRKLNLDVESNADLFGRLTSLENDKIYELLEDYDTYYNDECDDSLIKKYSNKLLALDKQKIIDIKITFFKELLNIYGVKNLPEKELEKYLITRVKWNVVSYMNNLAWNIYEKDKFTELSLQLVNTALKIEEKPEYFDTKAHILNKLKQYDEAIQAEEKAILLCGKCENLENYNKAIKTKFKKNRD
ncbi:hypothetical protein GCM10027035_25570 [Emticicia sediminis]